MYIIRLLGIADNIFSLQEDFIILNLNFISFFPYWNVFSFNPTLKYLTVFITLELSYIFLSFHFISSCLSAHSAHWIHLCQMLALDRLQSLQLLWNYHHVWLCHDSHFLHCLRLQSLPGAILHQLATCCKLFINRSQFCCTMFLYMANRFPPGNQYYAPCGALKDKHIYCLKVKFGTKRKQYVIDMSFFGSTPMYTRINHLLLTPTHNGIFV